MTGYKEYDKNHSVRFESTAYTSTERNVAQLKDNRLSSVIQKKQAAALSQKNTIQQKTNDTGLPDNLKSGIENLSGHSMDDVKVHYNSSQPAQLNAHAFAQGNQIHVAPGQEKHLPHEAWHVVQQKQGRVRPTKQLKGKTNINDDEGLENEADRMGAKAAGFSSAATQLKVYTGAFQNNQEVAQLGKRDRKKKERARKMEIHGRRQRFKKMFLESENPEALEAELREKYEGDELAMANLKNAREDAGLSQVKEQEVTPKTGKEESNEKESLLARLETLEAEAMKLEPGAVGAFVSAQALYQDALMKLYNKSEIMRTHQSIGLEFEFATYNLVGSKGSHTDLAKSKPLSTLFNLAFVLETDSGQELEIGLPPFLVKQDANAKKRISRIWLVIRELMGKIREESKEKDIAFLVNKIQGAGLGAGWETDEEQCKGMTVSKDRTKHQGVNKDSVYSQLNISMSGSESAGHLKRIAEEKKHMSKGERELIIPIYEQVHGTLHAKRSEVIEMSDEIFTHLAKSVTSIMAIPSVLVTDNPMLRAFVTQREMFDLHSTVKELHGIWIKDSLPNILRTIGSDKLLPAATLLEKTKAQLLHFVSEKIEKLLNDNEVADTAGLETQYALKLDPLKRASRVAKEKGDQWYGNADWEQQTPYYEAIGALITEIDTFKAFDHIGLFPGMNGYRSELAEIKSNIHRFKKNEPGSQEKTPGVTYLDDDGDWSGVKALVDPMVGIKTGIDTSKLDPSRIHAVFMEQVEAEMDALIKVLKESITFQVSPKTEFNRGERFGSGLGVRKDTHINTIETGDGKGKNVAEIRSDSLIQDYIDN